MKGTARQSARHKSHHSITRATWPELAAVILFIVGISVAFYPPTAQWVTQFNQSKIAQAAVENAKYAEPSQAKQVVNALEYNAALADNVLVDIDGRIPTLRSGQKTPEVLGLLPYDQQLRVDSTGLMGRIRMPAADVDIPIYHGTSDATLLKGAGHLRGTALPVGGEGGRTVITAHRGLAEATMFTHLNRVKTGDEFTLEVFGEVLVYRVFDIKVVEPEDTETIRAVPGEDLATLITCTPLGINTQRIVITGERVLPTPDDALAAAGNPSELPRFPWFLVAWAGLVTAFVGYYVRARRKEKARRQRRYA
ncbi:class C sortase [Trueperella abortisuis]|uniref:Sortase A n=1 Tax=Trueperella abortisuis TaxID=445930 RepID=A0ABT9PFG8_9ACTO|nr:class C sortase [Trueperella abortisuis]MDP9831454.1 sortase A [Trueperella abortisuis]